MGKAKRIIFSLLMWLTISPVFLISTRRWNQLNWPLRIILLLISPLFLCTYLLIFSVITLRDVSNPEKFHEYLFEQYSNSEMFEQSTGVRLPPFKVTEHELPYYDSFRTEFEYNFTIEFDNPISNDFYQYLDSLVVVDDNWMISAPNQEFEYAITIYTDRGKYSCKKGPFDYFYIHIDEGETKATIHCGCF